ncbi:hypothetical protein, partial [Akkermansia sp.]|uniref:hypothetical protein n=1 Tax=Akkermansia sp. TaxID=1872421 RepID=UPI003AB3A85F
STLSVARSMMFSTLSRQELKDILICCIGYGLIGPLLFASYNYLLHPFSTLPWPSSLPRAPSLPEYWPFCSGASAPASPLRWKNPWKWPKN